MHAEIRDLQVRNGILEREVEDLNHKLDQMRQQNARIEKRFKEIQASLDAMGQTTNQAHNMMSQLIRKVGHDRSRGLQNRSHSGA